MNFKKFLGFVCLLVIAVCLIGCNKDDKVITVGASPAPHAEILEQCKEYVESKGYTLEIVEFSDYILPNVGVSDGTLDANFFQHQPYLTDYNAENETDIVSVLAVHFEPLGLYAGKSTAITTITQNASIGIPNDTTNGARALLLLDSLDIIEIDSSKGLLTTKSDITSNPYNVEIVEFEAASLPAQLPSLDYAVINGNYAISNNIIDKLLASEDKNSTAATTYANILCVNDGHEEDEKIKVLIEALTQQSIKDYINDTYNQTVVPVF